MWNLKSNHLDMTSKDLIDLNLLEELALISDIILGTALDWLRNEVFGGATTVAFQLSKSKAIHPPPLAANQIRLCPESRKCSARAGRGGEAPLGRFFFSSFFFLGVGGAEVWGWINDEYRARGSAQSAAGNFAGVGSQEIWCRSRSLRTFQKTRAAHSSTASHVFFQYDCEQYFYSYIK